MKQSDSTITGGLLEWFVFLLFAAGAILVYCHYSKQYRLRSTQLRRGDAATSRKPAEAAGGDNGLQTHDVGLQAALDSLDREIQTVSQAHVASSKAIASERPTSTVDGEMADDRSGAPVLRRSVREWREAAGFTAGTLAMASGLKSAVVHQIENGTRTPTDSEAFALSNALGVSADQIQYPIRSSLGFENRSRPDDLGSNWIATGGTTSRQDQPTASPREPDVVTSHTDMVFDHPSNAPSGSSSFGDPISAPPMSLRAARERQNLTVKELADRSGIVAATLVQIENDTRAPTPEMLEALANALGIGASRLLARAAPRVHAPAAPMTTATRPPTFGERILGFADTVAHSRLPNRWIGSEEVLEIGGHTIRGGMFYVGREMLAPGGSRTDPSLIDPSARISASGADVAGTSVPYWPSYSGIGPAARLAHLQWLAGGRSDPDYGICYPFIFLYGLERRLLYDGAEDDARAIAAEVERLLAIYGRNYSFRNYGSKLLGAAMALLDDERRLSPALELWTGEELPVAIRLQLGRRILDGEPLDADDALVWLLGHPETRTRTAVERCFAEARLVWHARFAERFPRGMKVAAPKRTIGIRYAAASREFEAEIVPSSRGRPIPDVVGLSAPLKWMREALDVCSEDLQAYSRLLGRKPEARGTIEAALLLPKALIDTEFGSAARTATEALRKRLAGSGTATMALRGLMSCLGLPDPADSKIPAATLTQVGTVLDRLDLGMEPDRRYGPAALSADTEVVLFSAPGGGRVDAERGTYKAIRTMIEVAALAAAADDSKDLAELAAIEADIEAAVELVDGERVRLRAFARHVMGPGAKQGGVLSRLAKMPDLDRRKIARGAMSAVLADGHASPAEIRFLEKLYKTMGLPVDDLYSAIHRGAVEIDEPVSVAPEEISAGVPIPGPHQGTSPSTPGTSGAPTVFVDQARLDRIRSETSAVSRLLADIFEEDAQTPTPSTRPDAEPERSASAFSGLDSAHGRLLRTVEERGTVDRDEFGRTARHLGLLPDGAIETINEWAFDRFEEPILEEVDDEVAIPDHLRAELNDASEMA